jgi:predicted nucleic acid-binding protein
VIKFVFDASAIFRFVDREAGAERVRATLRECIEGRAEAHIPAVQWGEIAAVQRRRLGAQAQEHLLASLLELHPHIAPATAERAERAAVIRIDRKIPNADSYAIELAMDSPDHLLVTADYDFKEVSDLARIEFLPAK